MINLSPNCEFALLSRHLFANIAQYPGGPEPHVPGTIHHAYVPNKRKLATEMYDSTHGPTSVITVSSVVARYRQGIPVN